MILIPVLILQIFMFPMFTNVVMNQYINEQKTLELQETASYLSSSIQQIYLSLNHTSVLSCTLNNTFGCNPLVDGYYYTANATLQAALASDSSSSEILTVNVILLGADLSTSITVTLGQNVQWVNSTLNSNSAGACIIAQKFPDQIIQLSFGT